MTTHSDAGLGEAMRKFGELEFEARRKRHKALHDTYKPLGPPVFYDWKNPYPQNMVDRVAVMKELWERETHVGRHYNPEQTKHFKTTVEHNKGLLYGPSGELIASGTIGSSQTMELIVLALNTLPELLQAWEKQNATDKGVS